MKEISSKSIKSKVTERSDFLLYKSDDGEIKVDVFLQNENIWMSQEKIATLFAVQRPAITKHLKNIFESEELSEKVVSSILERTTAHGAIKGKTQIKPVKFYNLDAIIAVGYRVNSKRATQFRIWANKIIKEFIIKGFVMDDERLKDPRQIFGKDYFEEQLARIRDIRSSERRIYQKITDIYTECSIDYDKNSEITTGFFATVQNKLHFAITGCTAAEIVKNRANVSKKNMGLETWKNAPKGRIRKKDVAIAKNYLSEKELGGLNRIVTMYLDYAELQAKKMIAMTMTDWVEKLNAFLIFNEEEVLQNAGKVSAEVAKDLAENEYGKFRVEQDKNYISDFDREVRKLLKNKK